MVRNRFATALLFVSILGFSPAATANTAGPQPVALLAAGRGMLEWIPLVESDGMALTLAGPKGVVLTYHFPPGEAPALSLFEASGGPIPDGTYTWELRATSSDSAHLAQSGYFTISGGSLVAPDLSEAPPEGLRVATSPDQMVPDDLIIDGKGCIGLGCVNNEAFGAETLRLKQAVVRLRFEDTSSQAAFPTRDWQLTINDSASGGTDRFSLDDLTAGTTPVTVRGGAPSNSLYLDGSGNIGLGTATPAQDLHVASSSAPTVRLDQTGGTPRTWDVGGSNTSFFVKDVSNGGAMPLRISAGAPASSLEVAANGDIGVSTATPTERLHVFENVDANTIIVAENPNTGASANGALRARSDSAIVNFQAHGSGRTIVRFGETLASWAEFLMPSGNGLIVGTTAFKPLILGTGNVDRLHITGTGEIGIGTKTPGSKLHVNGGDVRVSGGSFIDDGTTLNVPDYVFEPGYRLMSPDELKAYVAREKRLPGIPNHREIKEHGLDLSEFQMRLLEKVEELTLYSLAQYDEIVALKDENTKLQARLEEIEVLEERLHRLEAQEHPQPGPDRQP